MKCKHENYDGKCRKPINKICPKDIEKSNGEHLYYECNIKKNPVAELHKQMNLFADNLNKKYKGIK